jgi:hypothetical protein
MNGQIGDRFGSTIVPGNGAWVATNWASYLYFPYAIRRKSHGNTSGSKPSPSGLRVLHVVAWLVVVVIIPLQACRSARMRRGHHPARDARRPHFTARVVEITRAEIKTFLNCKIAQGAVCRDWTGADLTASSSRKSPMSVAPCYSTARTGWATGRRGRRSRRVQRSIASVGKMPTKIWRRLDISVDQ